MKCQIPYHFVYVKLWDRVAYDLKLSVVFDLSHGSLHCERAMSYMGTRASADDYTVGGSVNKTHSTLKATFYKPIVSK